MLLSGKLLQLQQNLKTLPGIGEKTALRLAMYLVSQDKHKSINLANSINEAVSAYTFCKKCNMLSETEICSICKDSQRDYKKLCLVENTRDVYSIENTKEFNGFYFVLGRLLSPIEGIGPNEINLYKLIDLIKNEHFDEIIFALSPSTEGETTIHFIAEHLKNLSINLTRLSTGIPYGGDMEFTGTITLLNAFRRRFPV